LGNYSNTSIKLELLSSTVKGLAGKMSTSGPTVPGKRAVARFAINPLGGNRAWWNAW